MSSFDINKQINPLLDHYLPHATPEQRRYTGRHLPALAHAQTAVRAAWLDDFGVELPDTAASASYTHTADESAELRHIFAQTNYALDLKYEYPDTTILPGKIVTEIETMAAQTRQAIIRDHLDYDRLAPGLQLSHRLLWASALHNINHQRPYRSQRLCCGVTAFAINAAGIAPQSRYYMPPYDSLAVYTKIEEHRNSIPAAVYDVPWMLGALTTDYAKGILGSNVRVFTTFGMDLSEIDERIIAPLYDKDPSRRFGITATLSSTTNSVANHFVVLQKAMDGKVVVNDPLYPHPTTMAAQDFWNRWTPTNLQSVITVARPIS